MIEAPVKFREIVVSSWKVERNQFKYCTPFDLDYKIIPIHIVVDSAGYKKISESIEEIKQKILEIENKKSFKTYINYCYSCEEKSIPCVDPAILGNDVIMDIVYM